MGTLFGRAHGGFRYSFVFYLFGYSKSLVLSRHLHLSYGGYFPWSDSQVTLLSLNYSFLGWPSLIKPFYVWCSFVENGRVTGDLRSDERSGHKWYYCVSLYFTDLRWDVKDMIVSVNIKYGKLSKSQCFDKVLGVGFRLRRNTFSYFSRQVRSPISPVPSLQRLGEFDLDLDKM